MAKRKRLTPAQSGFLGAGLSEPPAPLAGPPIARVAGDAAATAALADLSAEIEAVRAGGRLIELLPLGAIDAAHLVRDRLEQDEDEMAALMSSLEARGQQTPIEVIRLPDEGGTPRYGLISGWRRLTALRRLYERTGDDRFATAKALVTAPETAAEAYVAMVEENEIRVNLSHYERARIAKRAVEEGVYDTLRAALQGLYANATRSKRSKIGSFVGLVDALDEHLRHPTAISEKLGLSLAKALATRPGFADNLRETLSRAQTTRAADELALLTAALSEDAAPAPSSEKTMSEPAPKTAPQDMTRYDITGGLVLKHWDQGQKIEISGEQVDADLCAALKDWLERR